MPENRREGTTDLAAVATYYERLWRERRGSGNVMDVNPWGRVMWSDLTAHFLTLSIWDREALQPRLDRIHKRLRREFPDEEWGR